MAKVLIALTDETGAHPAGTRVLKRIVGSDELVEFEGVAGAVAPEDCCCPPELPCCCTDVLCDPGPPPLTCVDLKATIVNTSLCDDCFDPEIVLDPLVYNGANGRWEFGPLDLDCGFTLDDFWLSCSSITCLWTCEFQCDNVVFSGGVETGTIEPDACDPLSIFFPNLCATGSNCCPDAGEVTPGCVSVLIENSGAMPFTMARENTTCPTPAEGPGTELDKLTDALGLAKCKGCKSLHRAMNRWGVRGCIENREYILVRLRKNAEKYNWRDHIKAITLAAVSGLAFRLSPLDPIASLLDEAVRRAAVKGSR